MLLNVSHVSLKANQNGFLEQLLSNFDKATSESLLIIMMGDYILKIFTILQRENREILILSSWYKFANWHTQN